MIKLIDILEIKIRPVSIMTKRDAFNAVYDFNSYFANAVYGSDTLDDLLRNYGYDSLESFLEDDFRYRGDSLKQAMEIIENYYNAIEPGDVIVGGSKLDVTNYKTVEMICPDDRNSNECFIVATKF